MSFNGNIEHISLHRIIMLIRGAKRSGVFTVRSHDDEVRIIFRFGEMIHGSASFQKESLMDFFVQQGIISSNEIKLHTKGEKISLAKLVQNFSQAGKLEIIASLKARAKIILYKTLLWKEGVFSFVDREVSENEVINLEKEVSELEQLENNDLDRLIRLKEWIPFQELIFSVNMELYNSIETTLTSTERSLIRHFDGHKSLKTVLTELEGEELFTLFSVLENIETGIITDAQYLSFRAVSPAWDKKISSFFKVYEGIFKKIISNLKDKFKKQAEFYFKNSFKEAANEYHLMWQDAVIDNFSIPLHFLKNNVQKCPVNHQITLLKNSLNALVLQQLITIKLYAGIPQTKSLIKELNSILSILQDKGNIFHKEIAQEMPSIFSLLDEFPSFIEQAEYYKKLNKFLEAQKLLNRIPPNHPDRQLANETNEQLKRAILLEKGIESSLLDAYKALSKGNLLRLSKLIEALKIDSPNHPEIQNLEDEYSIHVNKIKHQFNDLTLKPKLSPNFDLSKINAYELTQEEGFIISRIDGFTNLKGILAISGMPHNTVFLTLHRLLQLNLIILPESERKEPEKEKISTNKELLKETVSTVKTFSPTSIKNKQKEPTTKTKPFRKTPLVKAEEETFKFIRINETLEKEFTEKASVSMRETSSLKIKEVPVQANISKTQPMKRVNKIDKRKIDKSPKQLRKEEAAVFFSAGVSAMGKKDYETAIDNFEKAIKHFSASVAYYQYLDRARNLAKEQKAFKMIQSTKKLLQMKQYKEASRVLKIGLSLVPRNIELLRLSVEFWKKLNNIKNAAFSLHKLIEMEPGNSENYVLLGKILLEKRELAQARSQFLLALQWNKNDTEAKRQLNLLP